MSCEKKPSESVVVKHNIDLTKTCILSIAGIVRGQVVELCFRARDAWSMARWLHYQRAVLGARVSADHLTRLVFLTLRNAGLNQTRRPHRPTDTFVCFVATSARRALGFLFFFLSAQHMSCLDLEQVESILSTNAILSSLCMRCVCLLCVFFLSFCPEQEAARARRRKRAAEQGLGSTRTRNCPRTCCAA